MQKFDLRKLREQQLARLRNRFAQSGTLSGLRTRVPRLQGLSTLPQRLTPARWREYLVPGIAFLILALALFLSKFTPPSSSPEAVLPAGTSGIGTPVIGPTIIGNDGDLPFPEATLEAGLPTPVPTTDGIFEPGYPNPGDPNAPFPFETAPSIDGLPTPDVAGGDNPFPEGDFPTPDVGEIPTTDPAIEQPPNEYPLPDF